MVAQASVVEMVLVLALLTFSVFLLAYSVDVTLVGSESVARLVRDSLHQLDEAGLLSKLAFEDRGLEALAKILEDQLSKPVKLELYVYEQGELRKELEASSGGYLGAAYVKVDYALAGTDSKPIPHLLRAYVDLMG